jgi:hypothetical protein
MRDNHTFKRLSNNVDEALEQISVEFTDGYTHGMLCTHDVVIQPIHAGNDFAKFIPQVREWYEQVYTMEIGGYI